MKAAMEKTKMIIKIKIWTKKTTLQIFQTMKMQKKTATMKKRELMMNSYRQAAQQDRLVKRSKVRKKRKRRRKLNSQKR